MTTVKRIFTIFVTILAFCLAALAQTPQQAAIERIKANKTYRYGEARATTEDEAKRRALDELLSGISQSVITENHLKETQKGNSYDIDQGATVKSVSAMTLNNCETITYRDGTEWVALKYIKQEDVDAAFESRRQLISELIGIGIDQERQLNIAGALKYYNWARNMLSFYRERVKFDLDGRQTDAMSWLTTHIPAVIDNIKISLDNSKIEYDESDYDHYTVNLDATYNGEPLSNLDVTYFNGEHQVGPVHAKSGLLSLKYPELKDFKTIDFKIVYDYPEEAALYDSRLKVVYDSGKLASYDDRSMVTLPVKIKKNKIEAKGEAQREVAAPAAPLATADPAEFDKSAAYEGSQTLKADKIDVISRPDATDSSQKLVESMQRVEQAIRSHNYESVRSLFTTDGYSLFSTMMNSGKVSVSRAPEAYNVETTSLFTVGRGIPVSIKNGRHVSNETVVFRFDPDGLIKSVAYALSKRAEDDIFREASWNIESRYSLLTFMEDYQTAFALKRIDLFEKVFSNSAIIITGSVSQKNSKARMVEGDFKAKRTQVNYKTFNKDEYLAKLRRDFREKSYIQITFEDTRISKVDDGGLLDNEVLWIELKQQYSSSNYSDKGFLALQLNLKPTNSQILVRTWTPTFMEFSDLKKAFPIGLVE